MNTLLLALITTLSFPTCALTNGISEVSTTYPLPVEAERLQSLTVTLIVEATASNNVEIAFGCDSAQEGRLDFLEEDIRFGYDCGAFFTADTRTGERTVSGTNVWTITRREIGRNWNALRLTRRGADNTIAEVTLNAKKTSFALILR